MKKVTAIVIAGLAVLGSASMAIAKPGPNGKNNHGLCAAYFNGSDTGRENKRQAPPFKALEEAARDAGYQDQEGESIEHAVMEYCNATSDKGIGGNPTLPES